MKRQPRGLALMQYVSPVAAEADIRAVGGSSGNPTRKWSVHRSSRDDVHLHGAT